MHLNIPTELLAFPKLRIQSKNGPIDPYLFFAIFPCILYRTPTRLVVGAGAGWGHASFVSAGPARVAPNEPSAEKKSAVKARLPEIATSCKFKRN